MHAGVAKAHAARADDPLLFFVDVDMTITTEFLHRCRNNAVAGARVYFPVVWSFYRGQSTPLQKSRYANTGLWRESGFGMACMHASDFWSVGGFAKNLKGWGLEDVLLFETFVKKASIDVVRAFDPGIYHLWHDKVCSGKQLDGDQSKAYMCKGAAAMMEGDKRDLAMRLAKMQQSQTKCT